MARIIRSKREAGFAFIGIIVLALLVGWFFEMEWFASLVDLLNEHGGWTFAYLMGVAIVTTVVAYIRKNPDTKLLTILVWLAVIGAALASPVIGA